MKMIFTFILLLSWGQAWAFGGGHHDSIESNNVSNTINLEINKAYLKDVKPIFKKSCFDCHSNTTHYPWYYKIPGIKQLIDRDIIEAKTHFDFSQDYPFISHDSQINDLLALSKSIKEENMPPFEYVLMHNETKISAEEKNIIEAWIKQSLKKLNYEE